MAIQTEPSARYVWVMIGVAMTLAFAYLGFLLPSDDSISYAIPAGLIAGGLVLAAWTLWRGQAVRPRAPEAEFLVVGWLLAYIALVGLAASQRSVSLTDSFFILPPLSVIPIGLRLALGDDGAALGRGRMAAYHAHQVVGVMLTGLGIVFIVSLFLAFVAPLPLVAGLMHLRAAHLYRQAQPSGPQNDPRLGFMR